MLVGEVRDLETAEICSVGLNGPPRPFHPSHERRPLGSNKAHRYRRRALSSRPDDPRRRRPAPREEAVPRMQAGIQAHRERALLGEAGHRDDLPRQRMSRLQQHRLRGRTLVAEIMSTSEDIKSLITQNVSYQKMRELARKLGMTTLYESGLKKVEKGVTSLEEVIPVTLGI